MKKYNIIKERKDFDRAFKSKNQTSSRYAYLYTYNNDNNYRFGICVSKKVGNAVTRNFIKRRIKDIIDKSKLHFNNKDYIIVMKQSSKNASYSELNDDIINLLKNNIE